MSATETPITREYRPLNIIALIVPRRVYNEEIGDAREELQTLHEQGAPHWEIRLKVISTCFWILINSIREVASAIIGATSPNNTLPHTAPPISLPHPKNKPPHELPRLNITEDCHSILIELARTFGERDMATLLLNSAGFPAERVPHFTTPLRFWMQILQEIERGAAPGGIKNLTDSAERMYPANRLFSSYKNGAHSKIR